MTTKVVVALDRVLREARAASIFTDAGFVLSREPATVRGPDVAVVSHERLPPEDIPVGLIEVAPDIVFEIASPSNTAEEIQGKVSDYLDAGTRLVCVIHPGRREVVVHRSRNEIRILEEREVLDGDDVTPGLRFPLAAIFRS